MDEKRSEIVDLLINRVAVKLDVANLSESVFSTFKKEAITEIQKLRDEVNDERMRLRYEDKGTHEFYIYVGSDALVFQLHRNVFRLPEEHSLWGSDYLENDRDRAYFGVINIYNFLAESFEQNRLNDAGYLIGRILMNKDNHFMVEGEGQLGFLFCDLSEQKMSEKYLRHILQCGIGFAIEFDLITPPFKLVQEVSVLEILSISSELQQSTGKRLGFKFSTNNPAAS